jgi:Protein of unknown function (DUF3098)
MSKLPFGKKNYQWMVIGLVVLAFGFTIMALDKEQFGFMGITLGPVIVISGFIGEIFAILHTPREKK